MKWRNSSRAFLAFAFLLVICCSGILPTLGLRDSQIISSYGTLRYSVVVPPDGYCYHSVAINFPYAYQGSVPDYVRSQLQDFIKVVGKGVYAYFSPWGVCWKAGEPFWQISPSQTPGCFPPGNQNHKPLLDEQLARALCLTIWPCIRGNWDNVPYADELNDETTVKEIAAGLHDNFIREQANVVKSFGYPIFIRFGHEFNINQGSGHWEGEHSWAKNPTDFVNAWKRYVDIFRSEKVLNAVFVWCPNYADNGYPHHWTEYYPGDDYVDWVGIDLYQYFPESDPEQMMRGVYSDYCDRKPIAICEWGANWDQQNYTDTDRAKFINKFFDAVEARPKIKMINYWYCGDCKFDPGKFPLATAAYSNRIANKRYIN